MHAQVDARFRLHEAMRAALARWAGGVRPAEPQWDRIVSTSRAFHGCWDVTRHPVGGYLLHQMTPLACAAAGEVLYPSRSNIRIAERGSWVKMNCDTNPISECALVLSLYPRDHVWPFVVETEDGRVTLRTEDGRGALFDSHPLRHGRRCTCDIKRSVAVILRYTRRLLMATQKRRNLANTRYGG